MIKFTIYLNPRTKKNSQQIAYNRRTGNQFITQSEIYKQYERECGWYMPFVDKPIDYPVNVKAIYYRDSNRRCDLNGLNQCLHDCLVKYGILKDDNFKIIASTDGSRVLVDKDNPRTEVEISEVKQ